MTGFELRISGIGSVFSTKRATKKLTRLHEFCLLKMIRQIEIKIIQTPAFYDLG